jgi:aspartate aminotransferase
VLLAPGQRLGFLALPPTMPDREELRRNIMMVQLAGAYMWASALIQHALAEVDVLSIDIAHSSASGIGCSRRCARWATRSTRRRRRFYLLPKSPWADDVAFCDLRGKHDILVLPGTVAEIPGYFRISLTASHAMIDRALPGFAVALEHARAQQPGAAR